MPQKGKFMSYDSYMFGRTAAKTKMINFSPKYMRGGIRL